MERSCCLIIFSLLIALGPLHADSKSSIYNAYLNKDMATWKVVMTALERTHPKTLPQILELVNYQYGYIGWCLGVDKKSEAKQYMDKGEANLSLLEKQAYQPSQVNAYKAAFIGFRLGLTPLKAPVLGPKSLELTELAIKQDKNNPLGYLQFGNGLYYRPKVFGGSKVKAMTYYHKAERLMEASGITNDWNYLNLLALIGMAYQDMGEADKAEAYYQKALRVEPRFTWVKDELYPLLKQHNHTSNQ